jgi:hypothetical protein
MKEYIDYVRSIEGLEDKAVLFESGLITLEELQDAVFARDGVSLYVFIKERKLKEILNERDHGSV